MAGLLACVVAAANAEQGPCDILQAAGQPCVAAHSTTRALYSAYDGGLYILQKRNMQRKTIGVVKAGGFADKAAHDQFCGPMKDCVFLSVLDQSPMGNHLTQRHKLVSASQHPIHVGSNVTVYGMYFDPGYGYHVDDTKGVAKGNEPESIYAVMSGTHYNGGCCFECVWTLLLSSALLCFFSCCRYLTARTAATATRRTPSSPRIRAWGPARWRPSVRLLLRNCTAAAATAASAATADANDDTGWLVG